jgi:hypothetical protein
LIHLPFLIIGKHCIDTLSDCRIFVNTSGAGKTRLLLEGLARTWGMYFVCEPMDLGSRDLYFALMTQIESEAGFKRDLSRVTHELLDLQVKINCLIAQRRFSHILLARLLVFKQFISLALHTNMSDQDLLLQRKRWNLLQILPYLLNDNQPDANARNPQDIFSELSDIIHNEDFSNVRKAATGFNPTRRALAQHTAFLTLALDNTRRNIRVTLFDIYALFKSVIKCHPDLIYVVDEIQYAANQMELAFRSEKDNSVNRPIVRELLLGWRVEGKIQPWIKISGTGLNYEDLDTVISSIYVKGITFQKCIKTGSFDTQQAIDTYMDAYIPTSLRQFSNWNELSRRCFYWLKGRYGSLATANLLVLTDGKASLYGNFHPASANWWIPISSSFTEQVYLRFYWWIYPKGCRYAGSCRNCFCPWLP